MTEEEQIKFYAEEYKPYVKYPSDPNSIQLNQQVDFNVKKFCDQKLLTANSTIGEIKEKINSFLFSWDNLVFSISNKEEIFDKLLLTITNYLLKQYGG